MLLDDLFWHVNRYQGCIILDLKNQYEREADIVQINDDKNIHI